MLKWLRKSFVPEEGTFYWQRSLKRRLAWRRRGAQRKLKFALRANQNRRKPVEKREHLYSRVSKNGLARLRELAHKFHQERIRQTGKRTLLIVVCSFAFTMVAFKAIYGIEQPKKIQNFKSKLATVLKTKVNQIRDNNSQAPAVWVLPSKSLGTLQLPAPNPDHVVYDASRSYVGLPQQSHPPDAPKIHQFFVELH